MGASVAQEDKPVAERYRFTDGRVDRIAAPSQESASEGEAHEHHVHIYLDGLVPPSGTTRVSRPDANAGGPGELRESDPTEEQETGPLLCVIRQNGEDGSWSGELADNGGENGQGTPLRVRATGQGLEIYHALPPDETGDADPAKLGIKRPEGSATLDGYRAFDQRALAELRRTGTTRDGYAASRAFAAQMAEAFRRKR
jgi:hypothetical protein